MSQTRTTAYFAPHPAATKTDKFSLLRFAMSCSISSLSMPTSVSPETEMLDEDDDDEDEDEQTMSAMAALAAAAARACTDFPPTGSAARRSLTRGNPSLAEARPRRGALPARSVPYGVLELCAVACGGAASKAAAAAAGACAAAGAAGASAVARDQDMRVVGVTHACYTCLIHAHSMRIIARVSRMQCCHVYCWLTVTRERPRYENSSAPSTMVDCASDDSVTCAYCEATPINARTASSMLCALGWQPTP